MKTIPTIIILLSLYLSAFSQSIQWSVRGGNDTSGWSETEPKIKTDTSGNVFVTGRQINSSGSTGMDILTIKYNSSGTLLWSATYNGPSNGSDFPEALTVDAQGNVYVTGRSPGLGTGYDIVTIKYTANGQEGWVNRYSAAYGVHTDWPRDIGFDPFGNLYVCGSIDSSSAGHNNNFVLIKYNSLGGITWVASYNGLANDADDYAYAMGFDNSGNIYVTGESGSDTNYYDWATVKYASTGNRLWVSRYTSPGARSDVPYDIVVSPIGTCYVTGTSEGSNYYEDYTTIKISASGAQVWVKTYGNTSTDETAKSIAFDPNGYLFVSGITGSGFTTIKYDDVSGTELWVRSYNPGGNFSNSVVKVLGDAFGNAFIGGTGGSVPGFVFLKYSNNGAQQWIVNHHSIYNYNDELSDIVIDRNGFIYGTGTSDNPNPLNSDFLTVKLRDQSASTYSFHRWDLNLPINDNQPTQDTIRCMMQGMNMSPFYVNDISLTIDTIIHTRDSDLEISLIHQSVTDTAIYQVGGTGANFIGTFLDDSASTPIANGTAPFTGTFRPTKPLSQFLNTDPEGLWILRVYDRATGSTGTLKGWSLTLTVSQSPTGIVQINTEVTDGFKLFQNYPNPFNPKTVIKFQVSSLSSVKLIMFDILGREVETLVNEQLKPGTYEVDLDGSKFSSGVYFYKLIIDGFSETKKMVLVK